MGDLETPGEPKPGQSGPARKVARVEASEAHQKIDEMLTVWNRSREGQRFQAIRDAVHRLKAEGTPLDKTTPAGRERCRKIEAGIARFTIQAQALRGKLEVQAWNRVIRVPEPGRIILNAQGAPTAAVAATWNEGVAAVNEMLGRADLDGSSIWIRPAKPTPAGKRKASVYNARTGIIHMQANAPTAKVVHEIGHWLEGNARGVNSDAVAFLNRRRGTEALQSLAGTQAGYGPDEYAYFDQFLSPYMGKVYRDAAGTIEGTEIVSMGLEYMYTRPVELSQGDPDMFNFIWGVLRGL